MHLIIESLDQGCFLDAESDHNLKLSECLMVGDSLEDMEVGHKLGMETLLVLTGNGVKTLDRCRGGNLISYNSKNIYEGLNRYAIENWSPNGWGE